MFATLCLLCAFAIAAGFAPLLPLSHLSVKARCVHCTGAPLRSAGGLGIVDSERIRNFFSDSKVNAVTGDYTEQIVADVLVEAGFRSFPIPLNPLPRVKFELPNQLWTESKGKILGELDALVIGPSSAVSALRILCPVHQINDDDLLLDAPENKIVAVEVKSTMVTLLTKLSDFDGDGMAIIKPKPKKTPKTAQQTKNQETEAESKSAEKAPYWLMQAAPMHKMVFLNGGQRSKNFILSGGNSTNKEEREAWHSLRKAKVSLFTSSRSRSSGQLTSATLS
jgi:hypothetical protein